MSCVFVEKGSMDLVGRSKEDSRYSDNDLG